MDENEKLREKYLSCIEKIGFTTRLVFEEDGLYDMKVYATKKINNKLGHSFLLCTKFSDFSFDSFKKHLNNNDLMTFAQMLLARMVIYRTEDIIIVLLSENPTLTIENIYIRDVKYKDGKIEMDKRGRLQLNKQMIESLFYSFNFTGGGGLHTKPKIK